VLMLRRKMFAVMDLSLATLTVAASGGVNGHAHAARVLSAR